MAAARRGGDQSGAMDVKALDSVEVLRRASSRLSVKNIAFQASKEELRKLFATYGNVVSVRLPQKVGERQHRGFAFVEFMSKEDAVRAYEALQHTHLYGRRLVVEPAEIEAVSVDSLLIQAEKRKLIAQGNVTTESKRRKLVKDL
jgi:multiple RNA-binding domain-containing protein 1